MTLRSSGIQIEPTQSWKPYCYNNGEWNPTTDDVVVSNAISSISVATWSIRGSCATNFCFEDRINGVLQSLKNIRGIICLQDVSQPQLQRILADEWVQTLWVSGIDLSQVPEVLILSSVPLISIESLDLPVVSASKKLIIASTCISDELIRVGTADFSKDNSIEQIEFAQSAVRTQAKKQPFGQGSYEPVHFAFVAGNTKLNIDESVIFEEEFTDSWKVTNVDRPGYTSEFTAVSSVESSRPDRIYYSSEYINPLWSSLFARVELSHNPLDTSLKNKVLTPSNHYGVVAKFVPNSLLQDERDRKAALSSFIESASQSFNVTASDLAAMNKVGEASGKSLQYSYISNVLPGQRINSLVGFQKNANAPFFKIVGKQIDVEKPELPEYSSHKNVFGLNKFGIIPELYACENWSEVVNTVYGQWQIYSPSNQEFSISGSMVAQLNSTKEEDIRKQLAANLGVREEDTLDSSDVGFVLARVSKTIKEIELNKTEQTQLQQVLQNKFLALYKSVSKEVEFNESVKATLEFFNEHGTHYVQEITIGDAIYQVFVFSRENFDKVKAGQRRWDGIEALGFRYFTSSNYTKYDTQLEIFSSDTAFDAIRQNSKDDTYNVAESIFAMVEKNFLQLQQLTQLTCIGMRLSSIAALKPTSTEPVSELVETASPEISNIESLAIPFAALPTIENKEVADNAVSDLPNISPFLDLVAKQSLFTKYGSSIKPLFPETERSVYAKIWQPFTPELVSFALTKFVSIQQMYIHLDDLWKQRLVNRDLVDTLVLIADVVELGENAVDLSTIPNVIIVCRLLIANSAGNNAPIIKLSKSAFEAKHLYIGAMEGTASFTSPNDRRTVFGGVALRPEQTTEDLDRPGSVGYETYFRGIFPTEILDTESWASDVIQNGLDFMLEAIQISLTSLSKSFKPTAQSAWECLQWIVNSTNLASEQGNGDSANFQRIRSQALMISRSVQNPSSGLPVIPSVPGLNYEVYQPAIKRMLSLVDEYQKQQAQVNQLVRQRRLEQQQFQNSQEINENIKEIASFLLKQNQALADKEADMSKILYDQIDKQKTKELKKAQAKDKDLFEKLKKQIDVVNSNKDKFTTALKVETAKQIISNIISLTFTVAGMLTGSLNLKNLHDLGKALDDAEKIKKMEVLLKKIEQILKLVKQIADMPLDIWGRVNEYRKIGDAYQGMDVPNVSLDNLPSALDWSQFVNFVGSVIGPAKGMVPIEAGEYERSVKDLADLGKAYLSARSTIGKLQYEIVENRWRKQISQNHQKRLQDLNNQLQNKDLTPGNDYPVDLLHFGSILQAKTNNILYNLVKIFGLQDAALAYYYFQKPTSLTRFNIISIKEAMVQQEQNALGNLEKWRFSGNRPRILKNPIRYTIPSAPLSDLESESGHVHTICLDSPEFIDYVRVRIKEIDCRIDCVQTNSGKLRVHLLARANPFHDRGEQRETLTFRAVPTIFKIIYDLKTGESIFEDSNGGEFSSKWLKMTPFQEWSIWLPKQSENKGLRFTEDVCGIGEKKTTNIHLDFKVQVMPISAANLSEYKALARKMTSSMASEAVPQNIIDLEKRSVTNGWDVVVAMSASKITDLWGQRYEKEAQEAFEGDLTFAHEIDTTNNPYKQLLSPPRIYPKLEVSYALKVLIGSPKLNFVYRQPGQAKCDIPVIKGYLEMITKSYENAEDETGKILTSNQISLESTASKPIYITGAFVLEKAVGEVDDEDRVQLDSSQGAFGFFGSGVELEPTTNSNAGLALSTWFKDNKLKPWVLGSLLRNTTSDYLKPSNFSFSTLHPLEGDEKNEQLLLMFVQTTGTPSSLQMSMPGKVWPTSSKYDAAVFLSSRLIFEKVLKPAIETELTCNLDEDVNNSYQIRGTGYLTTGFTEAWSISAWNTVEKHIKKEVKVPLDEMTVTPNTNGVYFHFDKTWSQEICVSMNSPRSTRFNAVVEYTDIRVIGEQSLGLNLNSEEGKILLPTLNPKFNVTFTESNLWDKILRGGSSEQDWKAKKITDEIEDRLNKIEFSFDDISAWAVANLLFPNTKAIDLQDVFFPGDLVLVGNVVRDWVILE